MKGRFKVGGVFLLLILIALVPLVLAHYVFNHSKKLRIDKKNHGEFVHSTSVADAQVIYTVNKQQGAQLRVGEIKKWAGRWILIYDSQGSCCGKQCRLEMHQLHQVRLASHNGIERSVVALLLPEHCSIPKLERPDNVWKLSPIQASAWNKRLPSKKPQVLIIDPNGWVVMKYPENARPKSLYEDMRILLHASQIG